MNNYYFTESKWYGPLENGIDFNNDDEAKEYYLSLPSGPSAIPQFAGMVKELNKDFKFRGTGCKEEHCYCGWAWEQSLVCNTIIKTAVPVAEEGKQTFTRNEVIQAMKDAYLQGCDVTAGHKKGTSMEYITEYLKTKQ